MLLRISKLWRNRTATLTKRSDDGSVLIAVLGVLMVTIVIASVVSASAVQAMGYTSATRAGVQSQAASDAGIAAGRVIINKGTCTTPTLTSADPAYRLTIWVGNAAGSWTKSCPTASSASIRLVSTGYASSKGAAGQSNGDQSFQELILARQIVESSGAAVYLASTGSANVFSVTSTTGASADVRVLNGDFTCTSGGTYEGNIIVAHGNVRITNPCTIKGYIWASGEIRIDSGATIKGDLTAAGGQIYINAATTVEGNAYANGAFEIRNGGVIKGSVESTGTVVIGGNGKVNGSILGKYVSTIEGNVGGNVTSTQYAASGVETRVTPGSASDRRVGGNLTVGGTINSWVVCNGQWNEADYMCGLKQNGSVGGNIYSHVNGLAPTVAKPVPVVPAWVDVAYVKSDWYNAGFTTEIIFNGPASQCAFGYQAAGSPIDILWNQIKNAVTPTIFVINGCTELYFNNVTVALKTDVTIIAKAFGSNVLKVTSTSATAHQFNLIVPDTNANSVPTCNSGAASFGGSPGVVMSAPIYGILYTPCNVALNNGSVWRGQIYTGSMTFSAGDKLLYQPIGIPGVNLDNTSATPTLSPYEMQASRNRSDSGE